MEKRIKLGAKLGGGVEPGYRWSVEYLTIAQEEALRVLSQDQYEHVVDQIRTLAREEDPTHPPNLRVSSLGEFHELKEKGGPLGKINLRVFFCIDKRKRVIVLLGVIKKEADGSTPKATVILMRRRKRKYLAGDYGSSA